MGMIYELDDVELEAMGLNPLTEEGKRDRSNAYRPDDAEVERSEIQGDLIARFRAEY